MRRAAAVALLPLGGDLPAGRRRVVAVLALAGAAGLVAALLGPVAGLGAGAGVALVTLAGYGLVVARAALVAEQRRAWALFAVGLTLSMAAIAYTEAAFGGQATAPQPSLGDGLWLGCYLLLYAGFALLVRHGVRDYPLTTLLDGLTGALCVAALGWAFVVPAVGDAADGGSLAVATALAYPLADVMLLGVILTALALAGWRPGRAWGLLAAGMTLNAAADVITALEVAAGTDDLAALAGGLWALAFVFVGLAAWQRPRTVAGHYDGWAAIALPAVFAVAAIGLLVHGNAADVPPAATGLALAAIASAFVRTMLSFREIRTLSETRRQAATDDLTGLANRRAFHAELQRLRAQALAGGERLALVLVDLDGFKELNDTLGHHAGDLVLAQLGARLRDVVRDEDVLARLGGDEFAAILPGVAGADAALQVASRMRAALRPGFELPDITVHVDASFGIALLPDHGTEASVLLQHADVAMYQAKADRSGARVYDAARDVHTRERLELMGELRDAIARRELIVHFQPKAGLRSGDVIGVEALVRWDHPQRGLLGPGAFVALAEQTGLMPAMTEAVLRSALEGAAALRADGRPLTVAVNIAAANLFDAGFVQTVARLLRETGTEPSLLVLELTEETVLADPKLGAEVLGQLRALGVQLALDDFGTGYSSLSYLSRLPVDELKIDRAFVSDLEGDGGNDVIVRTVVDLARHLGLRTVAEGIEDAATWERLRDYGCEEAQGFHLARPMPLADLRAWLDAAPRPLGAVAGRP